MSKCKKVVCSGRLGLLKWKCKREAIKDGYCWQHHPCAVKKREDKSEKRLVAKPFYLINK